MKIGHTPTTLLLFDFLEGCIHEGIEDMEENKDNPTKNKEYKDIQENLKECQDSCIHMQYNPRDQTILTEFMNSVLVKPIGFPIEHKDP